MIQLGAGGSVSPYRQVARPVAVQPIAVRPVAVQPIAVRPVAQIRPIAVRPVQLVQVAPQPIRLQAAPIIAQPSYARVEEDSKPAPYAFGKNGLILPIAALTFIIGLIPFTANGVG